jgi:hypothetical protein
VLHVRADEVLESALLASPPLERDGVRAVQTQVGEVLRHAFEFEAPLGIRLRALPLLVLRAEDSTGVVLHLQGVAHREDVDAWNRRSASAVRVKPTVSRRIVSSGESTPAFSVTICAAAAPATNPRWQRPRPSSRAPGAESCASPSGQPSTFPCSAGAQLPPPSVRKGPPSGNPATGGLVRKRTRPALIDASIVIPPPVLAQGSP